MSKFNNFAHYNSAIHLNRYFADLLVSEAKKSINTFKYYSYEIRELIGNYERIVTDTYYGDLYCFEGDSEVAYA
jgi:hypothetical protein